MPNTKSAERRMRNSARKQLRNRSVKSRLGTLQKTHAGVIATGKKDDAKTSYSAVASALDKAVKKGTIRKATANRKKSRLALQMNKLK